MDKRELLIIDLAARGYYEAAHTLLVVMIREHQCPDMYCPELLDLHMEFAATQAALDYLAE